MTEETPKQEEGTKTEVVAPAEPEQVKKAGAKKGRKAKHKESPPAKPKVAKPKKEKAKEELGLSHNSKNKIEIGNDEEQLSLPGSLKTFVLLDPKSAEVLAKYINKQPRQAALKAATEGHKEILLREVGSTNKKRAAVLHRFAGEREQSPWNLPYSAYVLKKVEELSGKPVPPELNVKGGADALRKAGFKDFMFWKPNVKKVARISVPKVEGKPLIETVQDFVKNGLGA